jgi:membrane-associated phospholipid phosphatase
MATKRDGSGTFGGFVRRHWLGIAIWLVVAFFLVALLLDYRVSEALRHWPAGEKAFFHWITQYGESAWVLVPTFVLWIAGLIGWRILKPYWWRWTSRAVGLMSGFTFVAVGVPGLVSAIFKRLLGRARPIWLETEGVFSFRFFSPTAWDFQSFPSGHATTSLAFALIATLLFGRYGSWVFIPAVLIALSRVVIQMHYLSDIVFGATLGFVLAWAIATYWRQKGWVFLPGPGWRNRLAPVVARQCRRLMRKWRRGIATARRSNRT